MLTIIANVKFLDNYLEKLTKFLLVVSMLLMLGLSITTIIARWMGTSFLWIDPLVRHLVFLSAFLGGALATGYEKHIGIDVVTKILETKQKKQALLVLKRTISLISCIATFWLVCVSTDLVLILMQYGKVVMFGITEPVLMTIIPFGFFIISFRFLAVFLRSFSSNKEN